MTGLVLRTRSDPKHNHVTRDIKPPGKCPSCDAYWERHDKGTTEQ